MQRKNNPSSEIDTAIGALAATADERIAQLSSALGLDRAQENGRVDVREFLRRRNELFRSFIVDRVCTPAELPPDLPALPRRHNDEIARAVLTAFQAIRMMLQCARDPRVASDPEGMFVLGALLGREIITALSQPVRAAATSLPQQRWRKTGGEASKRLPGIWQRVIELVKANPKITTGGAWKSFPEEEAAGVSTTIYRAGNELVEIEDIDRDTTRQRTITYDTFRGYLKAARKELSTK